MKQLIVLFLIMLSFSCTEKIVQLPATTNKNITEVLDVSPIYMFYDEETDSVEFNRRNMISTTNWLVNIDKRLTLKQILPHLQYLQEKRHGDGMHKNENARNYFTCNNTDLKNLSFIEFTNVTYEIDYENISEPNFSLVTYFGEAKFNSLEKIELKIISIDHGVSEQYNDLDGLLNEINGLTEDGKLNLNLSFNSNLTYQDYIEVKTKILTIKSDSLHISNQEVIYN